MTTTTGVAPHFKSTRRKGRYQYVCRKCPWIFNPVPTLTRDERMWTLSVHLRDFHGLGPLVKVAV